MRVFLPTDTVLMHARCEQIQGPVFAQCAIFVAVVNICALAFYSQAATDYEKKVIDVIDLVCLFIFIAEAFVKIIVMGKR